MHIKVDKNYAWLFIDSCRITEKTINEVKKIVYNKIKKYSQDFFFSCCFSRFDLVIGFSHPEAKVLSYLAREVYQLIVCYLKIDITYTFLITSEIELSSHKEPPRLFPITFISFIKSKKNNPKQIDMLLTKFNELAIKHKCSISAHWTPCANPLLLKINGDCFNDMFELIIELRNDKKNPQLINNSTTFVCYNLNASQIKEKEKEIFALTYFNLENYGDHNTNYIAKPIKFNPNVNIKLESTKCSGIGNPLYRMGAYDMSLLITAKTLREVFLCLCEIKNKNKKIKSTATVLYYSRNPWQTCVEI